MFNSIKSYSIIILVCFFLAGCQMGCTSRFTGGTTKLPAPDNIKKIISFGKGKDKKWISYIGNDGKLYLKEYSNMGVFEAVYELTDARFDRNGFIISGTEQE